MDKDQEEMWEKLKRKHLTLEQKIELITELNNRLSQEQFDEMMKEFEKYLK